MPTIFDNDELDESRIVHLNVFSTLARDMLTIALNCWSTIDAGAKTLATNELVYSVSRDNYWRLSRTINASTGLDEHSKQKIREKLALKLVQGWLSVFEINQPEIYVPYIISKMTIGKFKALSPEILDKLFTPERVRYSAAYEFKHEVNLKMVACLADLIVGKAVRRLEREYEEEMVKRLVGVPADPFTAGSVEILLKQLTELKQNFDRDNTQLMKDYYQAKDKLAKDFKAKEDAINHQIDALRG